jgi:ketosteroid isomerase-like protein
LFDKRDLEGFQSYVHTDYRGWSYNSAVPLDKATARKYLEYDMKTTTPVLSDIHPMAIQIFGNVAIVHYVYTTIDKGADGKDNPSSGRWTDILMKQGDKWVMIGDHGGRTSKN